MVLGWCFYVGHGDGLVLLYSRALVLVLLRNLRDSGPILRHHSRILLCRPQIELHGPRILLWDSGFLKRFVLHDSWTVLRDSRIHDHALLGRPILRNGPRLLESGLLVTVLR